MCMCLHLTSAPQWTTRFTRLDFFFFSGHLRELVQLPKNMSAEQMPASFLLSCILPPPPLSLKPQLMPHSVKETFCNCYSAPRLWLFCTFLSPLPSTVCQILCLQATDYGISTAGIMATGQEPFSSPLRPPGRACCYVTSLTYKETRSCWIQ